MTQSGVDHASICMLPGSEQFRLLAETLPNIVWVCDERGSCTYLNNHWHQITGVPVQESLGLGWLPLIHPDDRERTERDWLASVRAGSDFKIEFRLRAEDGTHLWFKSIGSPVKSANGKVLSWVGSCINIDEQKRAAELLEARVRERTAALERVNKDLQIARDQALQASMLKSRFVANISHEIRTPMSGVLGMSELLLSCELNPEAKELAAYIQSSAQTLLDVVNDLLDFSKLEAGKLNIQRMRFSPLNIVSEVYKTTELSARQKNLTMQLDVPEGLPEVIGDPVRLRQVLLNLVHNAVKFTSTGVITVRVREGERKDNTLALRFEVSDTGIGISEEAGKNLFTPFEQVDGSSTRRYGGTGLGLSIARTLVSLMLGEIGFDSQPGEGSTFWFWLPYEVA